jgi:hypothetical protein
VNVRSLVKCDNDCGGCFFRYGGSPQAPVPIWRAFFVRKKHLPNRGSSTPHMILLRKIMRSSGLAACAPSPHIRGLDGGEFTRRSRNALHSHLFSHKTISFRVTISKRERERNIQAIVSFGLGVLTGLFPIKGQIQFHYGPICRDANRRITLVASTSYCKLGLA